MYDVHEKKLTGAAPHGATGSNAASAAVLDPGDILASSEVIHTEGVWVLVFPEIRTAALGRGLRTFRLATMPRTHVNKRFEHQGQ